MYRERGISSFSLALITLDLNINISINDMAMKSFVAKKTTQHSRTFIKISERVIQNVKCWGFSQKALGLKQ